MNVRKRSVSVMSQWVREGERKENRKREKKEERKKASRMPFLKRKPLPPYEFEDKEYLACDKNKIFKIRFTEEIFKDYK